MSVEVMQWLKGEIEKDTAEGKKMTLDFVSRLNDEVIRLQEWVTTLTRSEEKMAGVILPPAQVQRDVNAEKVANQAPGPNQGLPGTANPFVAGATIGPDETPEKVTITDIPMNATKLPVAASSVLPDNMDDLPPGQSHLEPSVVQDAGGPAFVKPKAVVEEPENDLTPLADNDMAG